MNNHDEILSYFQRKVSDIIFKYSIKSSATCYGNQHLRLSSYFGDFNENMVMLDNELSKETANILSNYLKEDMDIPLIIDGLCAYRHNAKLQYIALNIP
jgi:uncharacterized protein YutD